MEKVRVLVVGEPARVIPELTAQDTLELERQYGRCSFVYVDVERAEELRREAERAEVIVGRIPPALLAHATALRWLHLQSAGVNGYERRELYRNGADGVRLTRSAGVFSIPMAEHTLAMILALDRRLPLLGRQAAEHVWQRVPVQRELYGSRVLVVGAGDVAREIIARLCGFGCRVTVLRRRTGGDRNEIPGVAEVFTDRFAALDGADYIINTLPLTAATARCFSDAEFSAMKRGAVFINVGRGGTVDTGALTRALEDGRLGGAGLDVVDPEPLPASSPLWDMENVIITPHNSGDSLASNARRRACFEENLRRYLEGEPLLYEVDFDAGY